MYVFCLAGWNFFTWEYIDRLMSRAFPQGKIMVFVLDKLWCMQCQEVLSIWELCSKLAYQREGNGNPLQCSCLQNPRDGGPWWAAISGVAQSRTRLKRLSNSSSSLPKIHGYGEKIWDSWFRYNELCYDIETAWTLIQCLRFKNKIKLN